MPRVSQFFGVVISMYHNDHLPSQEYGEFEAVYTIDTLDILRGRLPRRAHNMVVEWALMHRDELRRNWDHAREQSPLEEIEPLD
ncbi:MAG: DUF4160 domain-containing protein [Thermoguttaceae bacterium]